MGKHLRDAIKILMEMLMGLSGKVESNVNMAFLALDKMDLKYAEEVIGKDEIIDEEEIKIEEECLKILALHQPVASDLRYLVTVMKMNNDLERIGDLAQDIAVHVKRVSDFTIKKGKIDFKPMYNAVMDMLQKSINSVVEMDKDMAFEVIKEDDFVDDKNRETCDMIAEYIKEDPENTKYYLQYIYISRRLERIADLTTNIAEDSIYLVSGEIVRHRSYEDM